MTHTKATIEERGNGFPSVGDYVPDSEGGIYKVVAFEDRIQTGTAPGASNWVRATVEPADWSDCAEGDEFPASVNLG